MTAARAWSGFLSAVPGETGALLHGADLVTGDSAASLAGAAQDAAVIVVNSSDLLRVLPRLRARHQELPLLVVGYVDASALMTAAEQWPGPLEHVLDHSEAAAVIRRLSATPALEVISSSLQARIRSPEASPVLRSAVRRLCNQRFPSEPDALEHTRDGYRGVVRTIRQLASLVGAKPDYVSAQFRRVGLRPSQTVRWVAALHAVVLFSEHLRWSPVATRLGFSEVSAWTHFCRSISGLSPRQLVRRNWRQLLHMAVASFSQSR